MYLFTYTDVQHDFHVRWCSLRSPVTRRVPHVEMKQELLSLPEHLRSSLDCSGVCVAQSLVFCKVFCRSLFFFFFPVSFGHSFVFPSSSYGFWLPLLKYQKGKVIRSRISKRDTQYNGIKKKNKRTNNDLQN